MNPLAWSTGQMKTVVQLASVSSDVRFVVVRLTALQNLRTSMMILAANPAGVNQMTAQFASAYQSQIVRQHVRTTVLMGMF